MKATLILFTAFLSAVTAFQSVLFNKQTTTTALHMANDKDFMRWARQSRSAGSEDNVVELLRPLGLVLNQDDEGNVFVETVAPKGNAARTGKVRKLNQKPVRINVSLKALTLTRKLS